MAAMGAEEALRELGIELPKPPSPVGAYSPYARTGFLLFISGQGPLSEGVVKFRGKVGKDLSLDEGYEAARLAALNCLAIAKEALGSLDKVVRIVKVTGYINCTEGFDQQPRVLNGASELLLKIFGEAGRHARAAVGANGLPNDMAVEVEMILEVK